MKSAETPLVGPFTLFPGRNLPEPARLLSFFGLEGAALVNFLVETKRAKRLAFVYPEGRVAAEVSEAIEQLPESRLRISRNARVRARPIRRRANHRAVETGKRRSGLPSDGRGRKDVA